LLLGKFGRLPLGFPADWVYESAFGPDYRKALDQRVEISPLENIVDVDLDAERQTLSEHIQRDPSHEEFVNYLNHPGDALKTIEFRQRFGDPNQLPLDVWFEGLESGQELQFLDSDGKPRNMMILDISRPDAQGVSVVRYTLDSEFLTHQVKVAEASGKVQEGLEMVVPGNPYHVGSPCNGDLWVMHVKPGDVVHQGEELFNISVMKQEKSILSPVNGQVKRVLKFANFTEDRKMVPVREGELLVELSDMPRLCSGCSCPLPLLEEVNFCPSCGHQHGQEG
jgi:pyruvate carboxylase